ncbi:hypothetical protein [Shewanella marisflavi]|uniref:Uncharacterized protein n=1 Tax=Shewanella marisflavi TaxID=260364 RepID=A0AAC9XMF6_9GAMM|nr:hypothetical protein [Shewanella marisflavi]ASJ95558.1 hypothetical protein CFF01_02580 [Shewanella marisflavi]
MKGRTVLHKALDIFLVLGVITFVAATILILGHYFEVSWFYITLESPQWIDIGLWSSALVSALLLILLLWLTLAFSFIALVSSFCVLSAIAMMFAGFSLFWPLLLLLLAAWGVGLASRVD